jgi:hypothetical protein
MIDIFLFHISAYLRHKILFHLIKKQYLVLLFHWLVNNFSVRDDVAAPKEWIVNFSGPDRVGEGGQSRRRAACGEARRLFSKGQRCDPLPRPAARA